MSYLALFKFLVASIPTMLKIAHYVMQAGAEMKDKPGKEKLAFVMDKVKAELPKLDSNAIYDWVNAVVYLLRGMGKPT